MRRSAAALMALALIAATVGPSRRSFAADESADDHHRTGSLLGWTGGVVVGSGLLFLGGYRVVSTDHERFKRCPFKCPDPSFDLELPLVFMILGGSGLVTTSWFYMAKPKGVQAGLLSLGAVTTFGLGSLYAGLGVGELSKVEKRVCDFRGGTPCVYTHDQDAMRTRAWTSVGTGVGLMAVGAILSAYSLSSSAEETKSSRKVSLVPTLGGAALTGRF